MSRFELGGTLPIRVEVHETTPDGHATRLFSVVLIYTWAQRIPTGGCYLRDANDIAWAIATTLNIPLVERQDTARGTTEREP